MMARKGVSMKSKTKSHRFAVARGRKRKSKGFTLVELMVTVTIIGILTTLGVVTYSRAQARARDGRRTADMVTIQNALEMYASENNGDYPAHSSWARSTDGDNWIPGLRPTYIKTIPIETHGDYYLYATTSGAGWWSGELGIGLYGNLSALKSYLVEDPEFGLIGYGCSFLESEDSYTIEPSDGLGVRTCLVPLEVEAETVKARIEKITIRKDRTQASIILGKTFDQTREAKMVIRGMTPGTYSISTDKTELKVESNGTLEFELPLIDTKTEVSIVLT